MENAKQRQALGVEAVQGRCHCGRVQFQARIDLRNGFRCNCTICTKLGSFVATAEPGSFVLSGEENLNTYSFGQQRLRRFFCKSCGTLCFARGPGAQPRQEDVNVNLNTLEGIELRDLPVGYFDGRHDNFEAGLRPEPWPMFEDAPSR